MPRTHRTLLWALSAALCFASATASAQNANLINTGRQQYEDLRYEEAIQTLSAALIRRGNTPAQEAQIYESLGLAYLALSRNEEAEGAFRLLFARAPQHRLDGSIAPRVREFFEQARQHWERDGRPGAAQPTEAPRELRPVSIEHRSPPEHPRLTELTLDASMVDPDRRAAQLVLAWRAGSTGLFHRQVGQRSGGRYASSVPGAEVRPPVLEYYFEAVDPNGIAVASRGDAYAPLRVVVPEARRTAITSRWWFWAGAAALVAGVAVGSYFIFSGDSADPAQLRIQVTGD
ncbi:MAG: hypothetical protein JNK72_23360 [Myxococcales bacterium]|nr:hypothetical protein [Myxococcales bacterium]